jgi:glycerol-3-phosphate O-acyltransferase
VSATAWRVAATVAAVVVGLIVVALLLRRRLNRMAVRAIRRHGARVDRYKLTAKAYVAAELLTDPRIAAAVGAHAKAEGIPAKAALDKVERYIDEMVPTFNVLAYYRLAYPLSERALRLFYRVSIEHEDRAAVTALPKDAVVIYLLNHRSNADYIVANYALAGDVAISWAAGEWVRSWPLEPLSKAFGSYVIRRRFREPLYHQVLESYVQLVTRNGVTQGIFPEGGLTRDGRLLPAKIGLLDYLLGIGREAEYRDRMWVVPVGINYDRVLEDRTLLRELRHRERQEQEQTTNSNTRSASRVTRNASSRSRVAQLASVARYLSWNLGRLALKRWRRYGRAAVVIGKPVPLGEWFAAEGGEALFALDRPQRLARVQALADSMMARIGRLIPVTPVPLACAAIQSLGADFLSRRAIVERMDEMRDVLREVNGRVLREEGPTDELFARAIELLLMRRVLAPSGEGYLVLPRGRELVSYYANSVAHLLGEFEAGVRERDALPSEFVITGAHRVPTPVGIPTIRG